MKALLTTILSLVLYPLILTAQIPMGGWRTHFSYNSVSQVEQSDEMVYALSSGAMFSVNKSDGEISNYSKLTGLNEHSISRIKYISSIKTLMVIYKSGNIDFISEDGIFNLPDLANKALSVDKAPNDILIYGDYAYLASDFGIVKINFKKKEIADTYIIGPNASMIVINSVAIYNDSIYAITDKDMYVASINNPLLVNYQNWTKKTNLPESSLNNIQLAVYDGKLLLSKTNSRVYATTDGGAWDFQNPYYLPNMRVDDNSMLYYSQYDVFKQSQTASPELLSTVQKKDILFDKQSNAYWIATDNRGLLKMQNAVLVDSFIPDGPTKNEIFTLRYQGGRMFALTGAPWETAADSRKGAVMIFENNDWKNITHDNVEPYAGIEFTETSEIAIDKNDPKHFYVATWGEGVFEFKDDAFFQRHYNANSTIEDHPDGAINHTQNIDGVVFDQNGHMWMNNMLCLSSIRVLLSSGDWISLTYPELSKNERFDQILVDENNYKWINIPKERGVFVIDDKNDPENESSHSTRLLYNVKDQDDNALELLRVNCMELDQDNNVWLGTNLGPVLFKNTTTVFNSDYTVYRPKIARNDGTNFADYLLTNQEIKAIAVDGANRKWIGTETSGLYLVSEDGLETILHFTKENSPLLSDNIVSLAVDPKSGEVFIATDYGLMSYMSDASMPGVDYQKINVYPNPVRPDFQGLITITGLVENSTVRITDASGNLVYQTKSNGGTAVWNGKNVYGNWVSSGAYFVMCTTASEKEDMPLDAVAKIMIIR